MGQKRGRVEGSFVRETSVQTVGFYRDIVQNLKAWYAPAPKLHSDPDEPIDPMESPPAVPPVWATTEALTSASGSNSAQTPA